MRIWSIVIWPSMILFMVFVSSCRQLTGGLATPSPAMSALRTNSSTPAPSSTPVPTVSPIPILTPSIIPTLPVEEAQARLLKLLSDNGGCRLPCVWGIVPGKSSFQEAQAILAPLGSVSEFTAFRSGLGSVTPNFTEGDVQIYTTLDFIALSDNHIVDSVAFNAEAHRPLEQGGYEDVFDSEFFSDKVSAYMLQDILSEQGIPSSVRIATYGGPLTRGGTGGFDILLLYPEQGILVNYTTQMHLTGTHVRGCPANAHVEMELYPPGQDDSFFERLKETDWAVKLNYYKPLEEVTNLSVEEFYRTSREPTEQCIETPANLWPIPEP